MPETKNGSFSLRDLKFTVRDMVTVTLLVANIVTTLVLFRVHINDKTTHLTFDEKAAIKKQVEEGYPFKEADRILLHDLNEMYLSDRQSGRHETPEQKEERIQNVFDKNINGDLKDLKNMMYTMTAKLDNLGTKVEKLENQVNGN